MAPSVGDRPREQTISQVGLFGEEMLAFSQIANVVGKGSGALIPPVE
jgi:hypothetical protein